MDSKLMNRAADNIRVLVASMVEKAKSGHPGGSMGGADFVNVLYTQFLVTDPDNPTWIARDRFFLDPGHMSPMLYSVLALSGKYTIEELQQLRQWGSVTPGHPELDPMRGVENTSGPLGQGHTMAVGCAIAERFLQARFGDTVAHKTYAFISDGGIQEEISQGAGRLAGHLGLSNLIMFYDANEVQLSTMVDDVDSEDYAAKYRAWNWNVIEIDGCDPVAIADALTQANAETERPTLIIGHTVMGKGIVKADGTCFEGQCSTHGQPISKSGADYPATVKNLGGDPENPWVIWDDVKALYDKRNEELRTIVAKRHAAEREWAAANPEKAQTLQNYIEGKLPDIDYSAIVQKANEPTRNASATVLGVLAEKVGNMIVSSADLANSDKTDGFLKKTHAFVKGDFSGAFLHAGVAELTMASVMNGIALHGACIAACGTFFVFSDYMKPAIRMAALMQLPVKY
ncbi:MAG: transketolase, partial [Muribaculaceae bacterium]|nr:transketolase [Muribaculaceae bacterium]